MTKQEYDEFMFQDALIEGSRYDMLVMGRTQGKGCYCYVNGVLKTQIDRYAANYRYIIVDNDAGLEDITRSIIPRIDILLLLSDASRCGIQATGRIARMVEQLDIKPAQSGLLLNRAPDGVAGQGVLEEVAIQ